MTSVKHLILTWKIGKIKMNYVSSTFFLCSSDENNGQIISLINFFKTVSL